MKYQDLDIDFRTKEISTNFDAIMRTQNVLAGLEYLKMRASTIKQVQIIDMITSKLRSEVHDNEKND